MTLENSSGHDHPKDTSEIIVSTPAFFNLVRDLIEERGELTKIRRYFGTGCLGQRVFGYVTRESRCEGYKTTPEGEMVKCEEKAVGSLDFDVGGVGDIVLVCSEDCFRAAEEKIIKQTNEQYRPTVIGINGFGRA